MLAILALLVAFALGSIPTGLWWARVRGIDLRRVGSGNVGAANTYRTLGWRPGLVVLGLDMLKGALAVLFAAVLFAAVHMGQGSAGLRGGAMASGWPVAAAAAAVLGHVVSPFAGFRGGKGVATAAGSMLVLAPAATLISIGVFAATVAVTRYVSLGSMLAAAALPLAVIGIGPRAPGLDWASVGIAALIISRHGGNIGRLLTGTERRFELLGRGDPTRSP